MFKVNLKKCTSPCILNTWELGTMAHTVNCGRYLTLFPILEYRLLHRTDIITIKSSYRCQSDFIDTTFCQSTKYNSCLFQHRYCNRAKTSLVSVHCKHCSILPHIVSEALPEIRQWKICDLFKPRIHSQIIWFSVISPFFSNYNGSAHQCMHTDFSGCVYFRYFTYSIPQNKTTLFICAFLYCANYSSGIL